MATHQRKIIRDAVRDRLLNATSAEDRVYRGRVIPLNPDDELPALVIYGKTEPVDPDSKNTAPRELARTLQVAIEAYAELGDDEAEAEDAADALALEVERVMHADPHLGGACSDSVLSNTDLGTAVTGERAAAVASLTYSVTYYTYAPEAEDVKLDDLGTVDTKTSLGGAQAPADQAEDRLTIPTT
jgi:hypothetical protein